MDFLVRLAGVGDRRARRAGTGDVHVCRGDVDKAGEVRVDERAIRLGMAGRQADVLVEQKRICVAEPDEAVAVAAHQLGVHTER